MLHLSRLAIGHSRATPFCTIQPVSPQSAYLAVLQRTTISTSLRTTLMFPERWPAQKNQHLSLRGWQPSIGAPKHLPCIILLHSRICSASIRCGAGPGSLRLHTLGKLTLASSGTFLLSLALQPTSGHPLLAVFCDTFSNSSSLLAACVNITATTDNACSKITSTMSTHSSNHFVIGEPVCGLLKMANICIYNPEDCAHRSPLYCVPLFRLTLQAQYPTVSVKDQTAANLQGLLQPFRFRNLSYCCCP